MQKPFGGNRLLRPMTMNRLSANRMAIERLAKTDPVLIGVKSAHEAMGLPAATILTSGVTMPFSAYRGGQRAAVIGGALYEGLAETEGEAIEGLQNGTIKVQGCQTFGCVGSLAGITTASMPVVVVADGATGEQAFCTLYEGDTADRLNYGTYSPRTRANLEHLRLEVAPVLDDLIRAQPEPIRLRPIMARALAMGDELHSRNAAATLLFLRQVLAGSRGSVPHLAPALESLCDDYFFLRLSMAACKVMANTMRDVPGSSVVTSMVFSCAEFGIQVAGLGNDWFTGPLPTFDAYRLEPGFESDDMEFMGGESIITEVVGLGGLAQAAGLPLNRSSGRSARRMVERTVEMYSITCDESSDFRIPVLDYRGTPSGLDVALIAETGITPYLDIGIAGRSGRQIGGGVARAPLEPFVRAWKALSH